TAVCKAVGTRRQVKEQHRFPAPADFGRSYRPGSVSRAGRSRNIRKGIEASLESRPEYKVYHNWQWFPNHSGQITTLVNMTGEGRDALSVFLHFADYYADANGKKLWRYMLEEARW